MKALLAFLMQFVLICMFNNDSTPYGSAPVLPDDEDDDNTPPPMPGGIAPEDASEEYEAEFSVHEDDFDEIKEGRYPAKLIAVKAGKSKAGNQMYSWTFAIMGDASAGKELTTHTAITPAAMWKLKEILQALGVRPTNDGKYSFAPSEVINREAILVIEMQEYEGKERPSIASVESIGQ